MTATATPEHPSTSGPQGRILADAGRRMLPVLASKLLAAVADRAEQGIDELADRLDDVAENGLPRRDRTRSEDGAAAEDDAPARPGGGLGSMVTLALQQARALLDLVVRLLAQAAAAARTATERLRARRAPQGIDDERAEHLEDDLEDDEQRATVGA